MTNKKHLIRIGLVMGIFVLLLGAIGMWHNTNAAICIDPYCGGGGWGGGGGSLTTIAPTLNAADPTLSYYINLTWTDNDPTSTFAVYRSTDNVNFSAIAINLQITQYHDAGLTCGKTYYYGVTAQKTGKNGSSMSNVRSATTICPPTLNSATAVSTSKISLTWTNNATNQSGFTLHAGLLSPLTDNSVSVGPTVTSYTFSNLTCGNYDVYLSADGTNPTQSSFHSNDIQVSLPCAVPPPTLNSATPISQTAMNIMFTNTIPNNGGGIYIYNNGALINTTGVSGITGTPTSFINGTGGWGPNLTCGTTYSYYARAFDGTNYSANSNTINGTTLSCSTPLNDNPYFITVSNSVAQPSYIDKGLASDTVYIYRVRPVFSDGSVGSWAVPKAAKTLIGSASITSVNAPVCTRNSYCDFSLKSFANTPGEVSEVQCANNNDCRKVGKLRSTYQEQ